MGGLVAVRMPVPEVLSVGETFDFDSGFGERLQRLVVPYGLPAFLGEPLVGPVEVVGAGEFLLHVGVGFEFGELVQLVERQLAEIGGHVARLLRDSGYLQPSADETVAASRLLGHLLDAHAQVEKPLVAVGLLYRSQVGALRVLHEHDLAFAACIHLLDDRGHGRESRLFGRGEPAMADDDAVLFVSVDVRLAVRRDQ